MQTDTVSPTVPPAVTLPTVGDNARIIQTKHGPLIVFSRRDLRQAMADFVNAARRDSLSLPVPQK